MPKAKVTSKGQITIPKKIREKLDLHPGDKIYFQVNEQNEIRLKKSETSIQDRLGSLKQYAKDKPVSIQEMNETIKQRAVERHERSK